MTIRRVVSLIDTKNEEHRNALEVRQASRGYLGPMAGGAASQSTARNLVLTAVASVALMLLIVMAHSWQYRDVLPSVLERLEFAVGFPARLGSAQALAQTGGGQRGDAPCMSTRDALASPASGSWTLPPRAR